MTRAGQVIEMLSLWSVMGPVLIVAAALVLIGLERIVPYVADQRFLRDGFATDLLGYTFLQSYVLSLLIGRLIAWMDGLSHLSRLHIVSSWPVWVQVLFFLVTHDLYIYLFHRLQHGSAVLWRLHEAHHATRQVDWLSGSRSHALEILINQTIEFAPIVLLGAAPEVALIKMTVDAIWGMYIHANIDVRAGRLRYILNGPEMHRWHHALEITTGVNFGTKLAVWDWLLGTAHLPPTKPAAYGLAEPFPRGYLAQQLHCFRRRVLPSEPLTPAGPVRSHRGRERPSADSSNRPWPPIEGS